MPPYGSDDSFGQQAIAVAARIHIYLRIYKRGAPMTQTRTAKLFKNGASQAVRLPVEYRFEGNEVYATRDDQTGDVTLSTRPGAKTWRGFFELMETIDIPADFMADRPMNAPAVERDLFGPEALAETED